MWDVKTYLPLKAALEFRLVQNGTIFLRLAEELGSFFKECRQKRGPASWKLREDEEYHRPADPRKGEEETENVGDFHE